MILQNSYGEDVAGRLTEDHPLSKYGCPVLLVDGEGLETFDVVGWRVIEATSVELEELHRGGYRVEDGGDCSI